MCMQLESTGGSVFMRDGEPWKVATAVYIQTDQNAYLCSLFSSLSSPLLSTTTTTSSILSSRPLPAILPPELLRLPLLPRLLLLLILRHLLLESRTTLILLHTSLRCRVLPQHHQLLHQSTSLTLLVADHDSSLLHVGLLAIAVGVKTGLAGAVVDELGFVGEAGGEFAGHSDLIEVAVLGTLDRAVAAVALLRGSEALVATDFAGETHRLPADAFGDGVVESVGFDGVPGAEEHDIAEEDLVFERGAEVALWLGQGALDLAADAGDGLDGGAFEFCDFEGGGEHVLDEGGVLEDLVGSACELELLDDFGGFVDAEDRACCGDAEAGVVRVEGVEADEAGVGGDERSVDCSETVHVLGSVLQHTVSSTRVGDTVDGEGLEPPPAE